MSEKKLSSIIKRNKWQIWRDVIFALFIREIRTGFSDKLGLAWAIFQPVAFIFALSFIRSSMMGSDTHTMPVFVFMAYGLMLLQFFLQTMVDCSSAFKKNKALFAFRQVQPISSILAVGLFSLLIKTAVFLLLLVLMFFMKIEIRIDQLLTFLLIVIELWLLAMTLGCLFALLESYVSEIAKVRSLLTRPLMFISGVFFSLQDIPKKYWPYLDWNPLLHAIELSRQAAYSSYGAVGVSHSFLSVMTLVFTFLALASYQTFWKQAISR